MMKLDIIVLILVLMDNQNTYSIILQTMKVFVLILVLMDNQNTMVCQRVTSTPVSLNPCSNG